MAEQPQDPCELLEGTATTTTSPDTGISVSEDPPVVVPDRTEEERGLFPVNEISTQVQALNRECILLDRHNYYRRDIQTTYQGELRYPNDAQRIQSLGENGQTENNNTADKVDKFRYVAGKVYTFLNGRLRYDVNNNAATTRHYTADANDGVPFDTFVFYPAQRITQARNYESVYSKDTPVLIRFDEQAFMRSYGQVQDPSITPLDLMMRYYSPEGSAGGLFPDPDKVHKDNTFAAPVGFFREEARESSLDLQDTVLIRPIVHNAPADFHDVIRNGDTDQEIVTPPAAETLAGSINRKSLYRLYNEIIEEAEPSNLGPSDDRFQVFPASAVQKIIDANSTAEDISNQTTFFDEARSLMNYHVKISFSAHHESPIARRIKELGLDTIIFDHLLENYPNNPNFFTQVVDQQITRIIESNAQNNNANDNQGEAQHESRARQFQVDELGLNDRVKRQYRPHIEDNFIEKIRSRRSNAQDFIDKPILTHHFPFSHDFEISTMADFVNRFSIPVSRLRRACALNYDTIPDFNMLMSGARHHSEVIAYRIEKKNPINGEVIQDFYIFNDPDIVDIDFLDTQVNYREEYIYKIYTINCVIGSEYSYGQESMTSADPVEFLFTVNIKPRPSFIEAPYFQKTVRVLDKPPLSPEVHYIPFNGVANESEFLFFARSGKETHVPQVIKEEDVEIVQNMLETQTPNAQGEIEYDSDSPINTFEMLVLEEPPLSYNDFSQARVHQTSYRAPSIIRELIPNKDYYVTYRSYDQSGVSNPGNVYKIRINSYENSITHVYEVYSFEQTLTNMQTHEMTMERTLSVKPSLPQCAINFSPVFEEGKTQLTMEQYQTAPPADSLYLGLKSPEESLWNKKFKFRLISKTTGRAIDLNVQFKQFRVTGDRYSQTYISQILGNSFFDGSNINMLLQTARDRAMKERIERNRRNSLRGDPSELIRMDALDSTGAAQISGLGNVMNLDYDTD